MDEHTMHGSARIMSFGLATLASLLTGTWAQAQYPSPRPPFTYIYPKAPDMTGPGFFATAPCGTVYGPNYSVVPCHMPFQGMVTAPSFGGGFGSVNGFPGVPYNPFVRSPRDFFMLD
jgi:hypothetical protein